MMIRPPWSPAVLLLALLAAGCGLECSEVGCGGGLGVQISTPDGAWPEGTYTLTLTADGQTSTCTLALDTPLAPSDSRNFTCDRDTSAALSNERRSDEDGDVITNDLVPGRYRLTTGLPTQPDRVQVTLQRDDRTLLQGEATPDYEENEINGPGCGVCRQGAVTLAAGA